MTIILYWFIASHAVCLMSYTGTELGVESFYISRLLQEFLHTLSITLPPTKQETNILFNTEQGLKI